MSEKVPPKKIEEWIEYGRQLSLNPHSSSRDKGAWVKAQGLDYVTDKVERSNAINLYKQVNAGVDLSECPHNRPSDILQWIRNKERGLFKEAYSVIYALKNRFMPGLIKIGLTEGSLARRLVNLNGATGVPVD